MRELGSSEARSTFGSLLDLVEHGEEVVITRRGKPVARLVRATGASDPSAAIDAARRIIANRKGRSLGGLNVKGLVEEGRM
jgi:prevent-host-death family protein